MDSNSPRLNKPVFLYNPTPKPVYVKDLDLKVKPGETLDAFAYSKHMTETRLLLSAERGNLKDALSSGLLILTDSNNKSSPVSAKFTESRRPIFRRQLLAPLSKEKSSNFIDRLQQDFGDRVADAPEQEIAKNTEKLINSVDFDGFDDPLE
jgi:hypothetical protein